MGFNSIQKADEKVSNNNKQKKKKNRMSCVGFFLSLPPSEWNLCSLLPSTLFDPEFGTKKQKPKKKKKKKTMTKKV